MDSTEVETTDEAECRKDRQRAGFSFANLFSYCDLQRVPPNTFLFREGEPPAGVYCIHSGGIDLIHERPDKEKIGRTAGPGEVIGLSAVISGCNHLSTAVASTPCEFVFIDRQEFRSLVDTHPAIWLGVLRQLSQNLNESYDLIRRQPARRALTERRRF